MHNPKSFYRELDSLLTTIGQNKHGKNFLRSIVVELSQRFSASLSISTGCIYENRKTEYVKIFATQENIWSDRITTESPAVQLVLEHGSFIYDEPGYDLYFGINGSSAYIVPAAIKISSPEKQWLLVFGLRENWVREEVTLFLNSVQTALNYRLFSDIIGGELEQAVEIQKSLLPQSSPKYEGYDIYGRSNPAELVGGDFYEYFNFDEGNFGLSIGDASGHGLPAALLVRDVVIGLRMGLTNELKLVHTVKKLNEVIQQSTFSSNFVSLFIGEMEKDGHFFYVNAGHPSPFLLEGDTISELKATGIVLGFLKDIKLHRSYANIKPDGILVMYTDGIIERSDSGEEQFGEERLKDLIIKNKHKSAKEIVDKIFKNVFQYGNQSSWDDDATVVVVKRIKEAE